MGNLTSSFFSGIVKVVGNIIGAPLDFLSGKSCSSVCGSTWDVICYVENFCVANLLKLLAVLVLLYIVLLFIYLLYKIGICQCLVRGFCKMIWGCISSFFRLLEHMFTFIWFELKYKRRVKQEEEFIDMEDYYYDQSSTSDDKITSGGKSSYPYVPRPEDFRRSRDRSRRVRVHVERSLRARSHRMSVGISRRVGGFYVDERRPGRQVKTVRDITVTRTSKFAHKGKRFHQRRRNRHGHI